MVAIADRRNKTQQDKEPALVLWFKDIYMGDVSLMGKKNPPLGEIRRLTPNSINVPGGFAIRADAYHYFIEWARGRLTNKLYIVRARLGIVHSQKFANILQTYKLNSAASKILAMGKSVGQKIGAGVAKIIWEMSDIDKLRSREFPVTDRTNLSPYLMTSPRGIYHD